MGIEVAAGGTRNPWLLAFVALVATAVVSGESLGAPTGAKLDRYSVTSSVRPNERLSGSVEWLGMPNDVGATSRVEFLIDGRHSWTEREAPYQYNGTPGGRLDTRALANGTHTLEARAVSTGGETARVAVSVVVANVPLVGRAFVGNFETGDLSQWADASGAIGASVVRSPTFGRSSRYALRCDTTDVPDSSVAGDGCVLYDLPWSSDRGDAWFRAQVLFPSGRNAAYPGTFKLSPAGGWNVVMEWHNSPCATCPPSYLSPTVSVGRNAAGREALRFRMVGGDAMRPTYSAGVHPAQLVRDRWYDIVVHIRWSADSTKGLAEWFVNGRRIFSRSLATLFRLPDGGTSKATFLVGHYRATARWTDTVYVDGVTVGPKPPAVTRSTQAHACFLAPPLQRFWIRCESGRKPS